MRGRETGVAWGGGRDVFEEGGKERLLHLRQGLFGQAVEMGAHRCVEGHGQLRSRHSDRYLDFCRNQTRD